MQIDDHKLSSFPFRTAHAFGGALDAPTLIVLHDTAGRLTKGSSVDWFCSADCGTSAHVVVERDGSITQVVPFNKIAFHAGKSTFKGKSVRGSCNAFSIGIEIVNPGILDKSGKAWFHKAAEKGFPEAQRMATKEHGAGWWLPYTPEQIEAVEALCGALVKEYPSLVDITTHWVISPGRKIDPNPLFPLDAVRAAVFDEPAEEVAATPLPPAMLHADAHVQLKEESWTYWAARWNLKSLSAAAAAVAAFLKDNPVYVVAAIVGAIVLFELFQYAQRQRVIS